MDFNKKRFRERRLELQLTQQELANLLGVSAISVIRWEKGESTPHDPLILTRIDQILSLSNPEPGQPAATKTQPNTYFVQKRSPEELERLRIQDGIVTTNMGGVLVEQPDPACFRHVLDVGCGTGDWLIKTAQALPGSTKLVGIDISETAIEYARDQAIAAQVSDRVEFHVMDALGRLDFPDHSFDLINQRFGQSWLRTWDWPKLLGEYQRVCRPGGTVRVNEYVGMGIKPLSGPALSYLHTLMADASYHSGHIFSSTGEDIASHLTKLYAQCGLQEVRSHLWSVEIRAETEQWQGHFENFKIGFKTTLEFLRKWTAVPKNYEQIYQQALWEMQQPDCRAMWEMVTVWGICSSSDKK